MSFGFSVGDFIAAASLAAQLIQALSKSRGSSAEYQALIQDLDGVRQTFVQLEQMRATNLLAQATINALSHLTSSSVDLMQQFLNDIDKFRTSLQEGGSTSALRDVWRKVEWSVSKPASVRQFRDSLQFRLTSIGVLVSLTSMYQGASRDYLGHIPALNDEDVRDLRVFDMVIPSVSASELEPSYQVQRGPEEFYRVGQVFMLQWFEDMHSCEDPFDNMRNYCHGPYYGKTSVRRFIVARQSVGSSYCLTVRTYGEQGCAKLPREEQINHAIVHTSKEAPKPSEQERFMTKIPIRIKAAHPCTALPSTSRVDFGRIYKVKHVVKSMDVGLIHSDSVETFNQYYENAPSPDTPSLHFSRTHGGMVTELDPRITREASLRLPGIHPLGAGLQVDTPVQGDAERVAQDNDVAIILKEAGEPDKGMVLPWYSSKASKEASKSVLRDA